MTLKGHKMYRDSQVTKSLATNLADKVIHLRHLAGDEGVQPGIVWRSDQVPELIWDRPLTAGKRVDNLGG